MRFSVSPAERAGLFKRGHYFPGIKGQGPTPREDAQRTRRADQRHDFSHIVPFPDVIFESDTITLIFPELFNDIHCSGGLALFRAP
jgi:hypothetical protein